MRGAALAAALVAAIVLPAGPPGIGVLIVAALVAVTVLCFARPSLDLVLFGSLALALAATAAVLDAGWVVALDLVASVILATLAVGGARLTAPAAPFVALSILPLFVPRPGGRLSPALRGSLAGGLLLLPFGVLFWTGDAAFAAAGRAVPVPALGSLPAQVVTFGLVLVAAAALAIASQLRLAAPEIEIPKRPFLEWAVPLGALDVLFFVFIAVQAGVLFGGHQHVRRTTGLTYAEYARHGFWQLLGAAALTLAVVATALLVSRPRTRAERRALRALLGALCVLTLLTVASAIYRLRLYETAFGLSRLRLAAEALAVWLGALFALLLGAGAVHAIRRHFPRIAVGGTALGLLAFSLANPDRLIAERNIGRWRDTGRLDVRYLGSLSADAVPIAAKLPEPLRSEALATVATRLSRGDPWSSLNLSRRTARATIAR